MHGETGAVTVKRLVVWLCVLFVILMIWNDPGGAGPTIGNFLGDVGDFTIKVIEKVTAFLRGL